MEAGGEIAVNFRRLYNYFHTRLREANLKKQKEPVQEILLRLRVLRDSWAEMLRHGPARTARSTGDRRRQPRPVVLPSRGRLIHDPARANRPPFAAMAPVDPRRVRRHPGRRLAQTARNPVPQSLSPSAPERSLAAMEIRPARPGPRPPPRKTPFAPKSPGSSPWKRTTPASWPSAAKKRASNNSIWSAPRRTCATSAVPTPRPLRPSPATPILRLSRERLVLALPIREKNRSCILTLSVSPQTHRQ